MFAVWENVKDFSLRRLVADVEWIKRCVFSFFQCLIAILLLISFAYFLQWQDTPLAKVFQVSDQWLDLKNKAQAVFVREAIKKKNLTLWEAFNKFDYNSSGRLNPPEFYGALRYLEVPGLTVEDAADFIDSADVDRDGIIQYNEYMDMLTLPDEPPDTDDSTGNVEEHQAASRNLSLLEKVPPYGAESIREVLVQRKKTAQAMQKKELQRLQEYKDALDLQIYEEELRMKSNPRCYSGPCAGHSSDKDIGCVEYSFCARELPLRFAPTGHYEFVPILRSHVAQVVKCTSGHVLVENDDIYFSYFNSVSCHYCRKKIAYPDKFMRCGKTCSHYVCTSCFHGQNQYMEQELNSPSKNPSYLHCNPGCSFFVQVPVANRTDPDDGSFTVSFDLRVEHLPPGNALHSLLRFTPPSATPTGRAHRASVYLNSKGAVLAGKGQCVPVEEGVTCVGVQAGVWCVVTVCVSPLLGEIHTYINDSHCHHCVGINGVDLKLHHKLAVLGGGKRAEDRGGDLQR